MSDPHGTHDAHGPSAHVPDAHGASQVVEGPHGSATDHGHAAETLGPIDWPMWGVGVLGVAVALAMTVGFVLSTGFSFGA